jgi:hypothetical protein
MSAKAPTQVETPPIQVLVTKLTPMPGRVEYHYTVKNGSAFPVHTLLVGNDEYYGGKSLLSHYPSGWDGDTLPSSSFQAPPGWTFAVEPTEEDSLVIVKWVLSKHGRAIMGGESAGGFTVVLDQADPAYETGCQRLVALDLPIANRQAGEALVARFEPGERLGLAADLVDQAVL